MSSDSDGSASSYSRSDGFGTVHAIRTLRFLSTSMILMVLELNGIFEYRPRNSSCQEWILHPDRQTGLARCQGHLVATENVLRALCDFLPVWTTIAGVQRETSLQSIQSQALQLSQLFQFHYRHPAAGINRRLYRLFVMYIAQELRNIREQVEALYREYSRQSSAYGNGAHTLPAATAGPVVTQYIHPTLVRLHGPPRRDPYPDSMGA